jgi:hypothetical protein
MLQGDPVRGDIAWKLAINMAVLDPCRRTAELGNWMGTSLATAG